MTVLDPQVQFQVLAQSIPVICWTADASGWIDWYNQRWYTYTGQTPQQAFGWGWQAALHPDDFVETLRRWPHSIATGEAFEMEFRLRRHDGMYRWFVARAEPKQGDRAEDVRWYGSCFDIDAQKQALQQSKRVAETLQEAFLPSHLPNKPDLRFDAVYLPAEMESLVGGDWYDAFNLPDGRIGFSIGDVAGHGLLASMLVGRLRQAIYTLAFTHDDPARILEQLNSIIMHQDPDTMVTAIVGFIDDSHRRITFSNAGHPPILVATKSTEAAHELEKGGLPLGITHEFTAVAHNVTLETGAVVALYTDGMIEFTRNALPVEARLKAAVALLVGDTLLAYPARTIREIVFEEHAAQDDAALLVMQFSAAVSPRVPERPSRTWRFHSSHASSARAVRREIIEYLADYVLEAVSLEASESIIGEVLANTVEHAPGIVEIDIEWHEGRATLTVLDSGPGLDSIDYRLPKSTLEEAGRGLYLIGTFADAVSVERTSAGTRMRIALPLRRSREPS